MQPHGWLIHSRRVCVGTASLGTMIDGNLETLLPLSSTGMGVILCHLVGMPLGSEEVEALNSSMTSNFLELEPRVTPVMGTWGGATIVDDVEASVRDVLEEMEVHTWGEEVAIESTSNNLAAGVPSNTTSNCHIASACNNSARLCI